MIPAVLAKEEFYEERLRVYSYALPSAVDGSRYGSFRGAVRVTGFDVQSKVRRLGHTRGMTLTTRMLTPETWDDFAALAEGNNGVWGGCWCIGFHPEGVGHGREGNRELKRQHVTRGTVRQVLGYDGDRCVGWCQFGPPTEVAAIKNPKAYEKDLAELPDWRIGCIFTNAKDRGKGVAATEVAAALDEIRRPGGGVVEAYPEQTEQRPPQRGAYLHTGPEQLYARYGFTRVRKIAKWRWVMHAKV